MLDQLFEGIETGRTNRRLAEGNQVQADVLSQADPTTGLISPEQLDPLASWNPELFYKLMSDYRQQQNTNAELEIARGKAAADAAKDAAAAGPKISDSSSMVGHVLQDPSYKNLQQAMPIWTSMQDAATRNTPQAHLNMVIGLAKLFDPTSVVRTQEGEQVINTGGLPAQVWSGWQFLQGNPDGTLPPEVVQGMLEEGSSRMAGYVGSYEQTKKTWQDYAVRHGMDPADIPRFQQFTPYARPEEAPAPPVDPANPDAPPAPDAAPDPSGVPSIPEGDTDAYTALPDGSTYTVPGHVGADGRPIVYTKRPRQGG
jgi:hypothetical protein